ncbi:MAG: NAD(P)H-quinone oxidoreductase [Bacteroidota bacterium]
MTTMKALLVDPSTSRMVLGEHLKPKPSPHDLLVKIKATALNRADLLQKAGKYPVPQGASPILGLEMAGVVEAVGERVEAFSPGDAVFGLLSGGGYAEYGLIPEGMAIPKPDSFSFEEATAIPEVFLTAWQALSWEGKVSDNETVLIHAGASGVGTAAIQLAKQIFDATVITTASREEKLDLCRTLGADLAINYQSDDFAQFIGRELGENHIDLIIDFVGSPYWEKNIDVLAMDGRMVILSMLGGATVEKMSLVPILRKRLTISGSTLRNRSTDYKDELTRSFWEAAREWFEQGSIRPVIDSIHPWEEVEKAHQRMKNNENAGKIILRVEP